MLFVKMNLTVKTEIKNMFYYNVIVGIYIYMCVCVYVYIYVRGGVSLTGLTSAEFCTCLNPRSGFQTEYMIVHFVHFGRIVVYHNILNILHFRNI